MRRTEQAFTLTELLVTMSILVLLVLVIARLVDSASNITILGAKRMDADAAARPILDRMAVDFAQIVKRSDVSYYVKTESTADAMSGSGSTGVNDWIGFYSTASGYYPSSASPLSVVAYRINSDSDKSAVYCRLERMGKGLPWNGVSTSVTPLVFLPIRIEDAWPSVASSSEYDSSDPNAISYEVFAADCFRFEYHYLLTNGTLSSSDWANPPAVDGLKKVAAIGVSIAVIDPRSRVLIADQIPILTQRLLDFPNNSPGSASTMKPGDLLQTWQTALDETTDMPRQAIAGVRLYERYFRISPAQ